MVLAAGILLLVALGAFLAVAKFRHPFNLKELPKRLGVDIQQEANGVTYSHSLGAHSQYKIHASKEVQLKGGIIQLHDVKIELYGDDGSRVDRIAGDEFEYDPKSGKASAAGPVEITLMRPAVAPSIAPKAAPVPAVNAKTLIKPLASAAQTAAAGEVHVKTSGLVFDWNSGITTTSQRVDFSVTQGAGSSMGATYDSQAGTLVLDREVELTTRRGNDSIALHAHHAMFERNNLLCHLQEAEAEYRGGQATAREATILFRNDGSAEHMEVAKGFALKAANGGHLAAPTGSLEFDAHNQPQHGRLEGGVQMDSTKDGRQVHGTSPTAELSFTAKGELSLAHLERGVEFHSEQLGQTAAKTGSGTTTLRTSRTWRSPVADVAFRDVGHGKVEPASIHGSGGVVVTGESQRGDAAPSPFRLSADEVNGEFGPDSTLTAMTGNGHAGIEETTATGTRQTASGDRLEAHFERTLAAGASGVVTAGLTQAGSSGSETQIQSATLDGHVVLVQVPAAKAGAQPKPPMRATAGRAVYEGQGEWLHLTGSPRATEGGVELAADKLDISQKSGDALAHGNVKATWSDIGKKENGKASAAPEKTPLGGQGPAHAIAQEATLNGADSETTFRGHARLWQQANSIEGPVIVIDRTKDALQSVTATSSDPAEPVRVVMLSAGGAKPGLGAGKDGAAKSRNPSVIRVKGGRLDYSDVERKAVMIGGTLGPVVAQTGDATCTANRVELDLTPAADRTSQTAGQTAARGQVDRMTADGEVVITSQGRRGTGQQLNYSSKTGEYVLTGTVAIPPQFTDPVRGKVTGEALIFHGGDDSVSIESGGEGGGKVGGRETRTETTVRQGQGRSEQQR